MNKQLYHKIPGVEKSVCTVEQLVAYRIASVLERDFGKRVRDFAKKSTMVNVNEAIHDLILHHELSCVHLDANGKYAGHPCNMDMVFCALNAGFKDYILDSKNHILLDYDEVGKRFPANYL